MASKADRPKQPTMRRWRVVFSDGESVEVEAEYRAMARHYAKCYVDRNPTSSIRHYRTVKSARLVRT